MERVDRHERNIPIDKDSAGGTMIYISDKLSYICRDDLESQNVESIWIELTPKNHTSHLICVVYRTSEHLFTQWSGAFNDQLTNAYIDCSSYG